MSPRPEDKTSLTTFVNESSPTVPGYWAASAWTEHVPFAFWLVSTFKPRVYVELGTHYGMSYFAACQTVAKYGLNTRCYAVDTWQGDVHAGFYSDEVYRQVDDYNTKTYAGFSTLLRMRFDEALDKIEDGSVDLLHVDGRHFYDDVKDDFESWTPKLSDRAIVIFHDTEVRENDFGVWKLWQELEDKYPSFNFHHGHGLGVIAYGKNIDPALAAFFAASLDQSTANIIRQVYRGLGVTLGAQREVQKKSEELEAANSIILKQKQDFEAANSIILMQKLDLEAANSIVLKQKLDLEAANSIVLQQKQDLESRDATVLTQGQDLEDLKGHIAHLSHISVRLEEERRRKEELFSEIQVELAKTRSKPFKTVADYFKYSVLTWLATLHPPLSARRAGRFARSAAKRNPRRSLPDAGVSQPAVISSTIGVKAAVSTSLPSGDSHRKVDSAKPTIMVVSHEASRSGAPILALNLVRELSRKYSVVSVILGSGDLKDDFRDASLAFYEIGRRSIDDPKMAAMIRDICAQHQISYALVNSVESRSVLPGLKECGVPIVALLHEFASYTRPITAFPDVFKYADQIIFSTRITLENALTQSQLERGGSIHILAQGKCIAPSHTKNEAAIDQEKRWLDSVLRPGGEKDREFLVIGAGSHDLRKGVNLFIECATRAINSPGGGRFRFVWIGNGYDPQNDTLSAVYLADQVVRAGIQAQVSFVRATSEIEHAYASADLLLLSSRLDPLPNVAIDTLIAGRPVVCFDRTTGIADFLIDNDLGETCVAKYLDSADMAQKIIALAADAELWNRVAARGQEAALRQFNFGRYVEHLDAIAIGVVPVEQQMDEDATYLSSVAAFRPDYFTRPDAHPEVVNKPIEAYLKAAHSGQSMRKPMPGFNPSIYAEHNDLGGGANPFVRFLRDGCPEGPWCFPVIDDSTAVDLAANGTLRVALHLHVFYLDELKDILVRLAFNDVRPDLFVSVPAGKQDVIRQALSGYLGRVVDIQVVPNRGRDIGPLLTTFGRALVEGYDIIGHMHTKKSPQFTDRRFSDAWSNFLLENLLGGSKGGPMLDRVLTAMATHPEAAIVYPDDPYVISWTENRGVAQSFARRMGIRQLPDQINFPVGNMFWMRNTLLERFVALNLDWNDYPAEPLPIDGTLLHAIERLFGVVSNLNGMGTMVTNVRGVSR